MPSTRHAIPLVLTYQRSGARMRISVPLPDGTPLAVHFESLDELGIYLAQSPLHWSDAAQVLSLVRRFMREDYEQGDESGSPHSLEECVCEGTPRRCGIGQDSQRAGMAAGALRLLDLNPWTWGIVIGAVLTYLTGTFFIGD